MTSKKEPFIGRRVGEVWICQQQLGTGSFGIVHVWFNEKSKETIALKKCRFGPEVLLSDKHKEQWRQEVDIMQRLDHLNVVKCRPTPAELQEVDPNPDSLPLLCMEYCSGGDLRKVLNAPEHCVGLSEQEVLSCVSDLASALGFLHNRRIIHRDLKPENVVLKPSSQRIVYKLIDLGYAKELGQSSMALSFVGTLQYIAPELFLSQKYTKSVDYWSLGFLCFEVITGRRPFLPNFSPGQWMGHVQKKSHNVICIFQKDPTVASADEGIVFQEHLFPENYLSRSLQKDMECWLRPLLEWDPSKRGKGPDGEVCIFKDLQTILSRTRIKVLRLDNPNVKMDVAVTDSTSGAEVMTWIKKHCHGISDSFVVLLCDGSLLTPEESVQVQVSKFYPKGDLVYVYDMSVIKMPKSEVIKRVALNIPTSIQPYLQNPRQEVPYPKRKEALYHAYYFVSLEQSMLPKVRKSVAIFIQHVLKSFKELNSSSQILSKSFERSMAKFDLFKESLFHDLDKYRQQAQKEDRITSKQIFDSWIHSESFLEDDFNYWKARLANAEDVAKDLGHLVPEVQRIAKRKSEGEEDLIQFVQTAMAKIQDLRQIPTGGRKEKESIMDIAQLIVKTLKHRDRCLQFQLGKFIEVAEIYHKINELVGLQSSILQGFDSFCHNVSKLQRRRQSDLWKLLAAAVSQRAQGSTSSPSGPGAICVNKQSSGSAQKIIQTNRDLRHQVQSLSQSTTDA